MSARLLYLSGDDPSEGGQDQVHTDHSRRHSELSVLCARIGEVALTTPELDALLPAALALILKFFPDDIVSVFLADQASHTAKLWGSVGTVAEGAAAIQREIRFGLESPIGAVMVTGQAQILEAGAASTGVETSVAPKSYAVLALPLQIHGDLAGAVEWRRVQSCASPRSDIALYQQVADIIALGLGNAERFTRLESRLWEAEALFQVNLALAGTLSMSRIARRAARVIAEQLRADRCEVCVRDSEDGIAVKRAEYTPVFSESLVQFADPLEIALSTGRRNFGIVRLFRNGQENIFSPTEVNLAQRMAEQVAAALEKAQSATEARNLAAQLGLLNRFSRMLSAATSTQELFAATRREIFDLVNVGDLAILLPDKHGGGWRLAYLHTRDQQERALFQRRSRYRDVAEQVALTRAVVHRRDGEPVSDVTAAGTLLGIPLIATNELIGALVLENGEYEAGFSDQETQFLTTVAGPLAASIQGHLLIDQLQQALARLSEQNIQLVAASEFSAATNRILDEQQLADKATVLIRRRFRFDFVGLVLVEAEQEAGVLLAASSVDPVPAERGIHLAKVGSDTLAGQTLADGHTRHKTDFNVERSSHVTYGIRSARAELVLPLKYDEQVIGVLHIQSRDPAAFSESVVRILRTLSDGLAVAVTNAQLVAQKSALAQQQQALNEISTRLHRSSEVEEIIDIGLRALSKHLHVEEVELRLDPPATP